MRDGCLQSFLQELLLHLKPLYIFISVQEVKVSLLLIKCLLDTEPGKAPSSKEGRRV